MKIIQKLIPGLRKDGYAEDVAEGSRNTGDSRPTQAQPSSSQPQIPRYDPNEEFPYRTPSHIPSRNPLEIGRRDLDPIPMNPFSPPSLFPSNGGDGMLVGPDHPIFDSRRGRGNFGDVGGPWGGDGFLPPMGAPPGARFDPVGPFTGGPFTGPGRTLGPNRGRNPLGGDPDNDEFMPPGAVCYSTPLQPLLNYPISPYLTYRGICSCNFVSKQKQREGCAVVTLLVYMYLYFVCCIGVVSSPADLCGLVLTIVGTMARRIHFDTD